MAEVLVVNDNGVHFAPAEDSTVHVMLDFPLNMEAIIDNALQGDEEMLDTFTDRTYSVADLLAVFDAAAALADSQNRDNADPGLIHAIENAVAIARRG